RGAGVMWGSPHFGPSFLLPFLALILSISSLGKRNSRAQSKFKKFQACPGPRRSLRASLRRKTPPHRVAREPHVRHETALVHNAARQRGGVAAHGARAAGGDARSAG